MRTGHAPIADWCLETARALGTPDRAVVFGVSGPQGGGKSTLTRELVSAMDRAGLRAVTVSIDDFYLTHREQVALAARHPGDRRLEHRGYAGTHDVGLGARVLRALALQRDGVIAIPTYDKSAFAGRGDRSPDTAQVRAPLDVVFVEGWMLGFRPLASDVCPPALAATNAHLADYDRWLALLDAFVLIVAERTSDIVGYRVDAERARRAAGESGLSDDEARDYIERFLPAYDAYVPGIIASPPAARWLRVTIDSARDVVAIEPSGDQPRPR